jgi:hypothetical protein
LSKREHKAQTVLDFSQLTLRQAAYTFCKEGFVEGDDLRDVYDRLAIQPYTSLRKGNISRCSRERDVRCNRSSNYGTDATAIELVGLDDYNGAPETGLGVCRIREVGPPHFSAPHHQSSFSSDCICKAASPRSSSEDDSCSA